MQISLIQSGLRKGTIFYIYGEEGRIARQRKQTCDRCSASMRGCDAMVPRENMRTAKCPVFTKAGYSELKEGVEGPTLQIA